MHLLVLLAVTVLFLVLARARKNRRLAEADLWPAASVAPGLFATDPAPRDAPVIAAAPPPVDATPLPPPPRPAVPHARSAPVALMLRRRGLCSPFPLDPRQS